SFASSACTDPARLAIYTLSLHDALPISIGSDQYGRPLYGSLNQQASALVATPGTNRRFADFDAVHLLESTGFSTYWGATLGVERSEEHTSELQSRENLVCRLLLEKKKTT